MKNDPITLIRWKSRFRLKQQQNFIELLFSHSSLLFGEKTLQIFYTVISLLHRFESSFRFECSTFSNFPDSSGLFHCFQQWAFASIIFLWLNIAEAIVPFSRRLTMVLCFFWSKAWSCGFQWSCIGTITEQCDYIDDNNVNTNHNHTWSITHSNTLYSHISESVSWTIIL